MNWRPLMLVAALSVLVKLPTLATPAFWDEMAYISQASWLADNGLWRVVPGLRSDGQFFGHPPGLHFLAASLFKVFGHSIEAAHVLIACFSAIGVAATCALVRTAHDAKTALLAALLLLLSPTWFYNAGVFLADLPVAALGTLCAVFVIRDRLLPYLVVASCMVLIKETAIKAICQGVGVTLTPPFTGDVGIVLSLGTSDRYCAQFGGDLVKNTDIRTKKRNAPAPRACP